MENNLITKIDPILKILNKIKRKEKKSSVIVYLSPQGLALNQKITSYFSKMKEITIICSKNSGIDDRVNNFKKILKISMGDYIINNGDLAAIILINSISRYNNNLIKKENIKTETFSKKTFEHKKYISNNKTIITYINILKKNVIKKDENNSITSFYRPDIMNRFKNE